MLNPDLKIAFVGGGNMAEAILSGLLLSGHSPRNLLVCAPSSTTRERMANKHQVRVSRNNVEAVLFADVVIVAVKPNKVTSVCEELRSEMDDVQKDPLVISVAAGVSWQLISESLGGRRRVVCAMPNLPTALCRGVTGLFSDPCVPEAQIAQANSVMRTIGKTVWVEEESQMPAIVATAGSAPAYFFLFMEAMEAEAIAQGLPRHIATDTVIQSALGAISMASQSEDSLATLRERVTSPKGTTEQAVNRLKEGKLEEIVAKAMRSAAFRTNELYAN